MGSGAEALANKTGDTCGLLGSARQRVSPQDTKTLTIVVVALGLQFVLRAIGLQLGFAFELAVRHGYLLQ